MPSGPSPPGQQHHEVTAIQACQLGLHLGVVGQQLLHLLPDALEPFVDLVACVAGVHGLQVALAHHQHMPLGLRPAEQELLQLVDEVLAVGQLGDRVAVGLQLQVFDALRLRLGRLLHAHMGVLDGVGHGGQLRHARFAHVGHIALAGADAQHLGLDFLVQHPPEPPQQQAHEQGPGTARHQDQPGHPDAAGPQRIHGKPVVHHHAEVAHLPPAVADGPLGLGLWQGQHVAEPFGRTRLHLQRLAFTLEQHLLVRRHQANAGELPRVEQGRHQQLLRDGVLVARLGQGQRQGGGGVLALRLQLLRQIAARRLDAERQRAQQDPRNRDRHTE